MSAATKAAIIVAVGIAVILVASLILSWASSLRHKRKGGGPVVYRTTTAFHTINAIPTRAQVVELDATPLGTFTFRFATEADGDFAYRARVVFVELPSHTKLDVTVRAAFESFADRDFVIRPAAEVAATGAKPPSEVVLHTSVDLSTAPEFPGPSPKVDLRTIIRAFDSALAITGNL